MEQESSSRMAGGATNSGDTPGSPTPPARKRGRPRKADLLAQPNAPQLRIRREDADDLITLYLSGHLVLAHLLTLREEAFAAIGSRPRRLVLDLRSVVTVEIAAISTLVTIGRVAGMVDVAFHVVPSHALRPMLEETGLIRLLPPPEVDGGEPEGEDDGEEDSAHDGESNEPGVGERLDE